MALIDFLENLFTSGCLTKHSQIDFVSNVAQAMTELTQMKKPAPGSKKYHSSVLTHHRDKRAGKDDPAAIAHWERVLGPKAYRILWHLVTGRYGEGNEATK